MTLLPGSADYESLNDLPRFLAVPRVTGVLRETPEAFQVDEVLGFEPDGEGEHQVLQIRKRNTNTEWLARALAGFSGVPPRDVSFSGLKDRNAVTTQWFSIRLAGRDEPDWSALALDGVEVLQACRHRRKLRRGSHRANRFRIRIAGLSGDREELRDRLERLAARGMPNYFGAQRFGRDGSNLQRAEALFSGTLGRISRHKRGLYLSAARAWLFNRVLGHRVASASWDQVVAGDILMLDGRHARFQVEAPDSQLAARARTLEVHPSGPLWGRDGYQVATDALELERAALAGSEAWRDGLVQAGLDSERRPLRAAVRSLQWDWWSDGVELSFELTRGAYATALLREILAES